MPEDGTEFDVDDFDRHLSEEIDRKWPEKPSPEEISDMVHRAAEAARADRHGKG